VVCALLRRAILLLWPRVSGNVQSAVLGSTDDYGGEIWQRRQTQLVEAARVRLRPLEGREPPRRTSMTENFPTSTDAALPSFTNSVPAATATTTGLGASATGSQGTGGGGGSSSSSGAMAGPSSLWQDCASRYLGVIIVSCLLLHLVL
jgi:hypothetical protein